MTEPSQYFKGRTVQEQMNEVIGYVDVRSAEVATTAIASDVAQVHQDMLDADADASAAAASAAAAAGTLANAVKKTGEASQTIAGDIAVAGDLTGGTVTVPSPVNNTDAASKKYVDDADALDAKLVGATFTGQLNASGQRAYAPGNTTDVATIGTLDAYTPMVRTTGVQTVDGLKTFNGGNDAINQPAGMQFKVNIADKTITAGGMCKLNFVAENGDIVGYIRFNNAITSGVRGIQIVLYDGSGNASATTLASVTI